jgi:hypothetical protein
MQGFVFDVLGLEDEKYQILRIIIRGHRKHAYRNEKTNQRK